MDSPDAVESPRNAELRNACYGRDCGAPLVPVRTLGVPRRDAPAPRSTGWLHCAKRRPPAPAADFCLRSNLRGHCAYFAVPGNGRAIRAFRTQVTRHWCAELRRRSQRHRLDWQRMNRIATRWLPPAHITHPTRLSALTLVPEAGAQCVCSARWDLTGGPPARAVPTGTGPLRPGSLRQLVLSVCRVLKPLLSREVDCEPGGRRRP
jgi:hypothetical protein